MSIVYSQEKPILSNHWNPQNQYKTYPFTYITKLVCATLWRDVISAQRCTSHFHNFQWQKTDETEWKTHFVSIHLPVSSCFQTEQNRWDQHHFSPSQNRDCFSVPGCIGTPPTTKIPSFISVSVWLCLYHIEQTSTTICFQWQNMKQSAFTFCIWWH